MNPAFPVDLHPESQTSHPQQTPMIPTPFPPAPSHNCLSPWAQPQPRETRTAVSSAAAGELPVTTILLLGKEVTLGLSLLHSS